MKVLRQTVLGMTLGIVLSLGLSWFLGESPLHIAKVLLVSTFGSKYDFAMTLFYMTPLLLTGLAVCWGAHAGFFNIGAEGQMTIGVLAATLLGIFWNPPSPWFAVPAACLVAFAAGSFWAGIAAWLKLRRQAHEVISTIMLNFIATAIAGFFVTRVVPSLSSQNPQTLDIQANYLLASWDPLKHWSPDAPLSSGLLFALILAFGTEFFLFHTRKGLDLRAVGKNPRAADLAGIHSVRIALWGFAVGGGMAGLVALPEVLGNSGNLRLGFSAGYGFLGIAVSLLGRNRPLALIPTAFLFALLHKGAMSLDLETQYITQDFSLILQALIILSVSATGLWRTRGKAAVAL